MTKLKIKIEGDEFDGLCQDLVEIALNSRDLEDILVLLRILQLLLSGEWEDG